MILILAILTLSGFNFIFWMVIGLIRFINEKISFLIKKQVSHYEKIEYITEKEVAAIVPAHNEELSIDYTINALKKILPSENIYIGSDASTDKTVKIARSLGVNVADIWPNQGKARVLVYLLKNFRLLEKYKAVMIIDADAEVDEKYLKRALPLFSDHTVAAVAGHGKTKWQGGWPLSWANFFLAYRVRLWRVVQYGMRYGQTWKYTNLTYIVPGSPSIYRTWALKQIYIDAPGLIIEDFNMTFELHRKKVGKIAYDPGIFGTHQDPYTFKDYFKQIRRWNLGFWQTVKRHGFWPSLFFLSTILFSIELMLFSIFIILIPVMVILFFLNSFQPLTIPVLNAFSIANFAVISHVDILDVILGVFVIDYLMTAIASFFEERPSLLVYGLGFFLLRYIDAFSFVYTLFLTFFVKSTGLWQSPKRQLIS